MNRDRRRLLAAAATLALGGRALAAEAAADASLVASQSDALNPVFWTITGGAPIRKGRVKLELPQIAENGNSVPMRVSVESPMTANDYVKAIHLVSDRNPVPRMASFYLGPRCGRAEVSSRVRLAGSQRVSAIAELSDGSFWMDSVSVLVTLSACMDES